VKKPLWKADWVIGAVLTLIFVAALGVPQLQRLERVFFDLGVNLSSARPTGQDVVVIAIDEATVKDLGPLPLPRNQIAKVIDILGKGKPKTIGVALDFHEVENPRVMDSLKNLSKLIDSASGSDMSPIFSRRVETALQDARRGLATDDYLANVLRDTPNVVLAMPYHTGRALATGTGPNGGDPHPYALPKPEAVSASQNDLWHYLSFQQSLVQARSIVPPNGKLLDTAAGLGHFTPHPDVDGRVRYEPMLIAHGEDYYPSLVLAMYTNYLRKSLKDITIGPENQMFVGNMSFPVDGAFRYLPFFYDLAQERDKELKAYEVVSFKDVHNGRVKASRFRNKVVLIGLTYLDAVKPVTLPTGDMVAPAMFQADILASLTNNDGYKSPLWNNWLQLATIVIIGLYLSLAVPRLKLATGLALTAVLVVLLVNVYTIVMVSQGMVLAVVTPTILLLLGHGMLAVKQHYLASISRWRAESAESNRMLGLAFQSQGQLDMAFEKFQRCPIDRGILELLYSLGLDFERRRQFAKAGVVFQYISDYDKGFRDVAKRILSNREMEGVLRNGSGAGGAASGTMVLSNSLIQKPMLGRYEVQKELGRGAMGMVYLGEDPKINRVVAIKTMALSHEFEEEELEAVKSRFFREASTAGRLNHPNIVTIYDVGDEQDLAYIAMDYLEGDNLVPYTKSDNLLEVPEVFFLISTVAKALDYAHGENVVHRDIKPANIMYDRAAKKVKITDFGVACLIDASKTKTGTILGTPSYMSPEQLNSSRVDGRSDIFSLGVMLFQLLTGELPFVGESMAALMYKITNEREPDIKMFRPDLPSCVNQILRRALAKEVEQRFQKGDELAIALQKCQAIYERRERKVS